VISLPGTSLTEAMSADRTATVLKKSKQPGSYSAEYSDYSQNECIISLL
jgi:hypothetical protein